MFTRYAILSCVGPEVTYIHHILLSSNEFLNKTAKSISLHKRRVKSYLMSETFKLPKTTSTSNVQVHTNDVLISFTTASNLNAFIVSSIVSTLFTSMQA